MLRAFAGRLQLLFWCGGVLLCGLAIWRYVGMRQFQAAENRRLEEALQGRVLAPEAPSLTPPASPRTRARKTGSLVGRIEIPRLKLSAIVLEGSDSRTLGVGVGRIPQTAEPGEAGNVVLGGHRDTFFRPLSGIRTGDRIQLVTPQGSYRYAVDWTQVVDPQNIVALKATTQPSLTLVTCYPFRYVGPAPKRFIVRAHQEVQAVTQTVTDQALPVRRTAEAPPSIHSLSRVRPINARGNHHRPLLRRQYVTRRGFRSGTPTVDRRATSRKRPMRPRVR